GVGRAGAHDGQGERAVGLADGHSVGGEAHGAAVVIGDGNGVGAHGQGGVGRVAQDNLEGLGAFLGVVVEDVHGESLAGFAGGKRQGAVGGGVIGAGSGGAVGGGEVDGDRVVGGAAAVDRQGQGAVGFADQVGGHAEAQDGRVVGGDGDGQVACA